MYGVERSETNYCNMLWYYSISYESLFAHVWLPVMAIKSQFQFALLYRCTGERKDLQTAPPLLRPGSRHPLPAACGSHEPHPSPDSPRWNIRVPIAPAKLHHLAGKVSKSCYKLREDRVAPHLWTLYWCPGDVMRIIPPLSGAKKKKKNDWNKNGF